VPEVAVKLCRFVKPVPSVLTANTVPLPVLPPLVAVPYRCCPINQFRMRQGTVIVGRNEPEAALNLWRFVKPVPFVLMANTVP